MENIIQHTAIEGQRWCDIAVEYYGKASMMNDIIKANPGIPLYDRLPGGVIVDIPIIDSVEVKTDAELLPPWKRQN